MHQGVRSIVALWAPGSSNSPWCSTLTHRWIAPTGPRRKTTHNYSPYGDILVRYIRWPILFFLHFPECASVDGAMGSSHLIVWYNEETQDIWVILIEKVLFTMQTFIMVRLHLVVLTSNLSSVSYFDLFILDENMLHSPWGNSGICQP